VLVIAHSPHGLEEVQQLVASSVIGATPTDVKILVALVAVTASFVALRHRSLALMAMDPAMARAVGGGRGWDFASAGWLGLVMGVTIHTAGIVYAFGCLVLPALIAKNVCRATVPMFLVAPLVALVAAVASFVAGDMIDLYQPQLTVTTLCVLLALAWGVRALRR
jgi:ABC-type Mn2+/Zn2+ transport system permease subunit